MENNLVVDGWREEEMEFLIEENIIANVNYINNCEEPSRLQNLVDIAVTIVLSILFTIVMSYIA